MKALLYSITAFLLISSASFAQTRSVYQQSYPTKVNTMFNLYVESVPVTIKQSKDNKIYVDLKIDFKNYSEKEIEEITDAITVNNSVNGKIIEMMIMSQNKLSHQHYVLNTKDALVFSLDDLKVKTKKKQLYKSKEELLSQINNRKDARGSFLDKLKLKKDDGSESGIDFKEVQTMETEFVVKVPKQVYLKLKARDSQVFVEDDIEQNFYMDLKKGFFKAKKLNNSESALRAVDTKVEIQDVSISQLMLEDTSKSLLGSISNTKCAFRGSKVEIGSVGKNNEILDYDSKLFLYNFKNDFEKLKLQGEYTELYLFDFDRKVAMKAEGDITYMVRGEDSNDIQTTLKVAVIEKQTDKEIYGKVSANLKKGILHVISQKD